jgi:hypothetical protein
MNWQTSYNISDNLKRLILDMCDVKLNEPPDDREIWQRTSSITLNSNTWTFYEAAELINIKEQIKNTTGLNTIYEHGYTCIWRYDEEFPKCPIHIDDEAQHKGSLCISLSGYHNIFLHDIKTKEKLEKITVKDNSIMFIKNSEYYHSVEGNGDLWILGVKK